MILSCQLYQLCLIILAYWDFLCIFINLCFFFLSLNFLSVCIFWKWLHISIKFLRNLFIFLFFFFAFLIFRNIINKGAKISFAWWDLIFFFSFWLLFFNFFNLLLNNFILNFLFNFYNYFKRFFLKGIN